MITEHPEGAEKEKLEKLFAERFPGKRLLAIQLDGFSHTVVYDDGTPNGRPSRVDVSFCMGEAESVAHERGAGRDVDTYLRMRSFLDEAGYGVHVYYQGHPQEVILVEPWQR